NESNIGINDRRALDRISKINPPDPFSGVSIDSVQFTAQVPNNEHAVDHQGTSVADSSGNVKVPHQLEWRCNSFWSRVQASFILCKHRPVGGVNSERLRQPQSAAGADEDCRESDDASHPPGRYVHA